MDLKVQLHFFTVSLGLRPEQCTPVLELTCPVYVLVACCVVGVCIMLRAEDLAFGQSIRI